MLILLSLLLFYGFASEENSSGQLNADPDLSRFFRAHVQFDSKREKRKSRHNCKMSVPLIVPVREKSELYLTMYFKGGRWETKSGKAKLVCGSEGRKPRKKLKAVCNRERRWDFNLDPRFDFLL